MSVLRDSGSRLPASVDWLFAEVRHFLDGLDDAPIRHLRSLLVLDYVEHLAPQPLPVLDWLEPALDCRGASSALDDRLLAALAAAAEHLSWRQSYSADEVGTRFLQRYGESELVGPRGPVASDTIRFGFLLLGPHIEYPSHAHGPEEIYWPLTDGSYWQKDTPAWVRGMPHRPIRHTAWMPHAMRTGETPLAALYVWYSGDLGRKPSFCPSRN